ncbi:MAG: hypothetical protein PHR28_03725 [candidate division Zixibacteria bacterium]|nr:hypothetical protein [candidate division Zixibacteria bacterium]
MGQESKSAMPPRDATSSTRQAPARLRPGLWAGLHYLAWSLIYVLLYPVSWLVRMLERRRERD